MPGRNWFDSYDASLPNSSVANDPDVVQ